MTIYYNEKTKKYGPATSVEQLTETEWAGVVSCGGDKQRLAKYYRECDERKQQILDVMKKEGKTTVEEYNEIRTRLFFS